MRRPGPACDLKGSCPTSSECRAHLATQVPGEHKAQPCTVSVEADSSAGQEGGRPGGARASLTSAVPVVYCCCCLANVSLPGIGGTVPESKPFFYVNVADIESLEVEVSYVACEYAPPILPPVPAPSTSASPAGSPPPVGAGALWGPAS